MLILIIATLLTLILQVAYIAFMAITAFAGLWLGWQVITKGSIPTHVVKPK